MSDTNALCCATSSFRGNLPRSRECSYSRHKDRQIAMLDNIRKKFSAALATQTSPSVLALSIAVGITCGIFPIPGLTTLACIAAIPAFRLFKYPLSAPLVFAVNYVSTPLNLATFYFIIQFGTWLLGLEPVGFAELKSSLSDGLRQTFEKFSLSLAGGVLGWLVLAFPLTLTLFIVIRPSAQRIVASKNKAQ
eukprot:c4450_g1_i1.p1 GENE.c4450_g1_i1~~c4450_g1_i1.p1  ORF type:complete len:192 (-),score=11.61 c4450_g1_i1:48-623(-)